MQSISTFKMMSQSVKVWYRYRKFKKLVAKGECVDIPNDRLYLYTFNKDGYPILLPRPTTFISSVN